MLQVNKRKTLKYSTPVHYTFCSLVDFSLPQICFLFLMYLPRDPDKNLSWSELLGSFREVKISVISLLQKWYTTGFNRNIVIIIV